MHLRHGSWDITGQIFGGIVHNMYGNWGGSYSKVTGYANEREDTQCAGTQFYLEVTVGWSGVVIGDRDEDEEMGKAADRSFVNGMLLVGVSKLNQVYQSNPKMSVY